MSNAVKSLSVPLAQCLKHRSSNQTLTGSNLAAYPLSAIRFFVCFFVVVFLLLFFFFFFFLLS